MAYSDKEIIGKIAYHEALAGVTSGLEKKSHVDKVYYYKNKVEILKKEREVYEKNRESILIKKREGYLLAKDSLNRKRRERERARMLSDPSYKDRERDRLREYKRNNKEKLRIKLNEYRSNNRPKINSIQKNYRKNNPEKFKAYKSNSAEYKRYLRLRDPVSVSEKKAIYRTSNREKIAWSNMMRNKKIKQATIGRDMYKKEIQQIYKEKYEKIDRDGLVYEVDHIIPIRGLSVSGLHVPWNLRIITKEENAKKSNKLDLSLV